MRFQFLLYLNGVYSLGESASRRIVVTMILMSPELSPAHKYDSGLAPLVYLMIRMMIQNMGHHHLSNCLAMETSLAI